MPWLILFGLALFLTWNGDGDPVAGAEDLYASITRGARLTHAPYDPTTGVVPGAPADLAATAGLTDDQYALARMLSSEEGNSDNTIKVAVCWAIINLAAKQGETVSDLLLHAVEPTHSGKFGTYKNIDPASSMKGKPDRRASTALDPYDGDGQIASSCLDGTFPDNTGGAIEFDRPGGEKDPTYTATKRATEGLSLKDVDGVDPSLIRFWG